MGIYLVAYDILDPTTDRAAVINVLETAYPDYSHIQLSVWLIDTEKTSRGIKADFTALLHQRDRLFVTKIATRVGALNLDDNGIAWLRAKSVEVV